MHDSTNSSNTVFSKEVKDLQDLIHQLDSSLQKALGGILTDRPLPDLLHHMGIESVHIHSCMQEIGDQAHRLIVLDKHKAKTVTEDQAKAYIICYEWFDRAKSYLILWRDIVFQWQKAGLLLQDNRLEEAQLEKLIQNSKKVLTSASNELIEQLESRIRSFVRTSTKRTEQIYQWKLQWNPWPTYREQLAMLPEQTKDLQDQHLELMSIAAIFERIQNTLQEAIDQCQSEVHRLREDAEQTIPFIEEQLDAEDPKPHRVVTRMQELEGNLLFPDHMAALSYKLEVLESELPKDMSVTIQALDGVLQFRTIDFYNSSKQWLESEIKPILFELWELAVMSENRKKMALVNIRNRASLLVSELKETGRIESENYEDIDAPIRTFIDKLEGPIMSMNELEDTIIDRLNDEFQVTNVYYAEQAFLSIPLQSTIKQLRLDQNKLWLKTKNWFQDHFQFIGDFFRKVSEEEDLSLSERIVRYIQHRTSTADNEQYHSIFLTKGYIGDSFLVGRTAEVDRVALLFKNWEAGYRGSLLVTGKRLSGKSLFGELLAAQVFTQNPVIRLQPNFTINIDGRKTKIKYDLSEALDFVLKHTLNKKAIVWIDDFELWWGPDHLLGSNARSLKKYIDDYANRLFFVISMNKWLANHLDQHMDLYRVFQAYISMDQMNKEEIREAILIRHGATHKILVNEQGEELQPKEFRRMTGRIYQEAGGIIGDALNLWSAHTQRHSEEEVIHQVHSRYYLPNFLTPEIGMLLSTLMLHKRSNEYRLRKLFGPAFKRSFSSTVQRLISVGILHRRVDGWLEVNELVANELAALLEQEGHLL